MAHGCHVQRTSKEQNYDSTTSWALLFLMNTNIVSTSLTVPGAADTLKEAVFIACIAVASMTQVNLVPRFILMEGVPLYQMKLLTVISISLSTPKRNRIGTNLPIK